MSPLLFPILSGLVLSFVAYQYIGTAVGFFYVAVTGLPPEKYSVKVCTRVGHVIERAISR